jgi:hypothetical protein
MPKCRHCRNPFTRERASQVACGADCALALAAKERVKLERAAAREERTADRAKAEALKPIRKLLSEAQAHFNAYIRERDKDLPCVSCGRKHKGAHDAGHYVSAAANPHLRFDEANVHKQCVPCNDHLSGNLIAYRRNLIERIGEQEVRRLETASAGPRKWTREELAQIKVTYSEKRRALVKSTAAVLEATT